MEVRPKTSQKQPKIAKKWTKTAQKLAKVGRFCWLLDGGYSLVNYSYRVAYIDI